MTGKTLTHPTPSKDPPALRRLLLHLLEQPDLISWVQRLEPPVLGRIIHHVGLEDAGELLALATAAQIEGIFDEDLWRGGRPGQDETFDVARFTLWLEVMLEAGGEAAARKLTQFDEDLVTMALHRRLLVLDSDFAAAQRALSGEDGDLVDKAFDDCLCEEFDGCLVVARDEDGWDTLLILLATLQQSQPGYFTRLLDRCCALATEFINGNGGLYEVLTGAESLESDVAGAREDRRAEKGYVAPSAAASFLSLALVTPLDELRAAGGPDPITRAYFRDLAPPPAAAAQPGATPLCPAGAPLWLLQAVQAVSPEEDVRLLLQEGAAPAAAHGERLRQAMAALHDRDPVCYGERLRELTYLTNVLVAGCTTLGRPLRPREAAEVATAACELGLEELRGAAPQRDLPGRGDLRAAAPDLEVLTRHSAVALFRIGWHLWHHELALPSEPRPQAPTRPGRR